MEEKIELSVFLSQLVSTLNKKFESFEGDIKALRMDIERLRQPQSENVLKDLENKIRNLEMSVNSLRSKNQIDKSVLKLLESEESGRRV